MARHADVRRARHRHPARGPDGARPPPDRLYEEWRHSRFEPVETERQIEERRLVVHRPFFQARLEAGEVGRRVNDLRRLAVIVNIPLR